MVRVQIDVGQGELHEVPNHFLHGKPHISPRQNLFSLILPLCLCCKGRTCMGADSMYSGPFNAQDAKFGAVAGFVS